MAALLLTGIVFGTAKVLDKREKKKAKKAALEFDLQQQSIQTSRGAALKDGTNARMEERRKSMEAAEKQSRSRSLSSEREAPPSYESAVAGAVGQRERSSSS